MVRITRHPLPLALLALPWTLSLPACALTSAHRQSKAATPAVVVAPSIDATGVWDWVFRSADDQGDIDLACSE